MTVRLLIAAGPTHEPLDAVRYLANRSSGRLGIALARQASRRGMSTTLLLGPTALEPDDDSRYATVRFRTAADLEALLRAHWPRHDVLIMAAAVADYRPAGDGGAAAKHPRAGGTWTLELEATPDLLALAAASARPDQTTIGFALDPAESLIESARRKLAAKHIDAIVANPLETMGATRIRATLILRDGRTLEPPTGECDKEHFADWLLDQIERIRSDE